MSHAKMGFFKLIVRDLSKAQGFYERAFGFVLQDRFETPDFNEAILRQEGAEFSLILLCFTDGRAFPDPTAHGPTGFVTEDVEAAHAAAVAAGATPKGPVMAVEGGIKVAFLDDPEGHEIELCQFG